MNAAAWLAWNWAAEYDFTGTELKVANEAKEFADQPSLEEAADVFISLLVACQKLGWTPDDLTEAVELKMIVNRDRVWELASDGTFQHAE